MRLPSDDAVEKAVIGSALLYPEHLPSILELSKDDFFSNTHKKIFDQIKSYHEDGKPVDTNTITDDGYDISTYLSHAGGDVNGYIKILRDKTRIRNIIMSCHNTIQQANMGADAEQLASTLGKIVNGAVDATGVKDMASMLMDVVKDIDEVRTGTKQMGISVGLDFDKAIGGFEDGNFYVVAARPAMGKSAFALEVAKRTAAYGVPVGFMSLEMSAQSLAFRLLTSAVSLDATDLRKGKLSEEEMDRVIATAGELSKLPLYFDDNSFVTAQTMRSRAHLMHSKYSIGMLVVDYLQLMTGTNETRERDIAEASRMCKVIAKELSIPVIALAQLNRGVEQRIDKRPMLSDLRESGAIEQDADVVMMLYRPEYYDQQYYGEKDPDEYKGQSTKDICEVIITKNRNGDVGGIRQVFRKNLMQFDNRSSIW